MATDHDDTPSRRGLLKIAATAAAALPAGSAAVRLPVAAAHDDPDAEDDADAASEAVEDLLRRMAATPAHGPSGIAAKAARLTYSLSDGPVIMHAEMPLAASLAADLARLAPQAVGAAA